MNDATGQSAGLAPAGGGPTVIVSWRGVHRWGLGGVTSGNDDREASCYQYDPSRSQYHPGERRTDRSLASAVRSAVRASGFEETFSFAAARL